MCVSVQVAAERQVCIVYDAEQTYLHPAIDLLTIDQMKKFNKTRPVVQSTYQAYLKVRTVASLVSVLGNI